MRNKRLNPYIALLVMTIIGATGTMFVVREIYTTDFTYAAYDHVGVL